MSKQIPYTRHAINAIFRGITGCPPVSSLSQGRRVRIYGMWHERITSRIVSESYVSCFNHRSVKRVSKQRFHNLLLIGKTLTSCAIRTLVINMVLCFVQLQCQSFGLSSASRPNIWPRLQPRVEANIFAQAEAKMSKSSKRFEAEVFLASTSARGQYFGIG